MVLEYSVMIAILSHLEVFELASPRNNFQSRIRHMRQCLHRGSKIMLDIFLEFRSNFTAQQVDRTNIESTSLMSLVLHLVNHIDKFISIHKVEGTISVPSRSVLQKGYVNALFPFIEFVDHLHSYILVR